LRLLRQHGMSVSDTARHGSKQVVTEQYLCVGYNSRMTDIQAALGVAQMKKLDWVVRRRRELAERYTQAVAAHPWLSPPYIPDFAEPNFQSYAVQIKSGSPVDRDELMQKLLDGGIATRRGIMLSHLEPPYANSARLENLEMSTAASENSFLIPLYPQMTEQEQDQVIDFLVALDVVAGELTGRRADRT
jgi:perosamine synthetase